MWKSTSGPRRWRGGALELRFDFRAAGVRVFRPIRAVRRYGQVLQHVGQHEAAKEEEVEPEVALTVLSGAL